jgi:hypothetical protein
MKRHTRTLGIAVAAFAGTLLASPQSWAQAPAPVVSETGALLDRSRAAGAAYQDKLRAQLIGAMKTGGPILALDVCKEAAPAIAREVSAQSGADVRRTSLKPRNPNSAPDAWEQATLLQFNARQAAGEDPATMETSAWVDGPTGRSFRYMKAIPMADACKQCHGSPLAPEVVAKLADAYPQDRATGYAPGEIRGALTVTWTNLPR